MIDILFTIFDIIVSTYFRTGSSYFRPNLPQSIRAGIDEGKQ